MAYELLIVYALFNCVMGYGLASNNLSSWDMLTFIFTGILALSLSYIFISFISTPP